MLHTENEIKISKQFTWIMEHQWECYSHIISSQTLFICVFYTDMQYKL